MNGTPTQSVLLCGIDERQFALHLESVDRVVRSVAVTPLPAAPEIVLGVINVEGRIIPVINTRLRLGLPAREIELNDHFVIARTSRRAVALHVETVDGVAELRDDSFTAQEEIVPGMEFVEGVLKLAGNLVLIEDLDRFLSFEEETAISEALAPGAT